MGVHGEEAKSMIRDTLSYKNTDECYFLTSINRV